MVVFTDLGQRKIDLRDVNSEEIMCVSAVVFKDTKYKQFRRAWDKFLKPWGASAFHATDFYGGGQEFDRETERRKMLFAQDSKRIPTLVGQHSEKIVMTAFKPTEYLRESPKGWKELFGTSAHSMAVQILLLDLGWWRQETHPSEKFAYFMEQGDVDESKVEATVNGMRNDAPTSKVIGIKSFSLVEKGSARGLEAADFWAWHWNKYYTDKLLKNLGDQPRKDFREAVKSARGRADYFLLSGNELRFFFSRVPKEVLELEAGEAGDRRDV